MKNRFRGILKFIRGIVENFMWAYDSICDALGIKRRHIAFGLLVLLISTLFTGLYIYQKNWFIEGKRKAGRSELQLTISLNGEDSAVQEMSEEIRDSILETPMAAASASQAAAQSASNMNAARSNPDSTSSQSAFASGAQSPAIASAAGSSSSFSPSVTTPNSSVMSGQARSEKNKQSMTQASAQSMAQSASGMNAARSVPSSASAQSAAANSAASPTTVSASGANSALSPSSPRAAISTVMTQRSAQSTPGQSMAQASAQSMAQSATGSSSSTRSAPSASSSASNASAASENTSGAVSAANSSSAFSPQVSSARASSASVRSSQARAESGWDMSNASSQSLAQAATGSRGTARNSPSQSMARASGTARAANTASTASAVSGSTASFSPSVSGASASTSGVASNGARAEAGRSMSGASGQSMAQAATGSRGTARHGPSQTTGQGTGTAQASNSASSISGSGASASFSPSASGISGIGSALGGGLTLGGGPINTDQVMAQARASSVSQPIRFTGARRHPLRAYASRPNESQPSAASVSVAMIGNPGGRGSFSPTITRTPQTIPTFEKVQPNLEAALVANNPSEELSELPPLANPYELRLSPKLRADFVKRQGGGPETEAAVALALEWLKRNQGKDGRWNHRSGHTTAATGAAMLAFLGWGAKHTEPGPYQQTLARAIDWMLSVEKNGDLRYRGNMYDHGIAAIALMEAYNLTKDERLRAPAERVLAFTLKAQNPQSGGWRYKPHREDPSEKGDLSVSGWQLMALKSARLGGMKVLDEAFAKARKFLDGVDVKGKGFQYRPGWTPSSAMIAEGLFCEQMLGAGVTTPKMEQCLNLIQKQLPSKNRVDYYYWYYGSLAMRQAQGQDWQSWNNKLKPILLRKQILRGNNRGAWEPEGKNSKAAGRVVTTALAALSLEVYYRYLPLYSPEFSKAGN